MFKKILVASDSVAVCDGATDFASKLAKKSDAGLRLLHVLESPDLIRRQWVKDFWSGEDIAATADYTQAVKQAIAGACAKTMAGCREYAIEVKPGFPWSEILKTARAMKADLIVLGPHGDQAREKGVVRMRAAEGFESTMEAVVMRAHCPVMIVNHTVPKENPYFRNILLCTDFSETRLYASDLTFRVARRYGSRIHVTLVLRIPPEERMAYTAEQVQDEMASTKEKFEQTYKSQGWGINCSVEVVESIPAVQIKEYARSRYIDLITIGSHLREQANRSYVGSVAEELGLSVQLSRHHGNAAGSVVEA